MRSFRESGGNWKIYMAVPVSVIIAAFLRFSLLRDLGISVPYLTFYPAVMVVAVYGGFWVGLATTLLSSAVISYYWLMPFGQIFVINSNADRISLAVFFLICIAISYICETMLQNRTKVQIGLQELQELNVKLQEQTFTLQELNAALEEESMERANAEEHNRSQAELLDLAYDFILVRDLESRIIYWNQGAQKGYGFTAEDALGNITHDLLQTVFPEPLEGIMKVLEEHSHWEGELIHTAKDGKKIIVQSHQTLRKNEYGEPIAILEINHDITAWKNAETALHQLNNELEMRVKERTSQLQELNATLEEEVMERQAIQDELLNSRNVLATSEARYRGLFENMPNIFVYYRVVFNEAGEAADLEYVEVNSSFENAFQLTAADIIGKRIMEVRPKIKNEKDWFAVLGYVAKSGKATQKEFYIEMHARYYCFSIYSPENGHVALIGEDVTERKKTEELLRESQEWYEAVMKKSSEGIAVIDKETQQVIEVNEAFTRLFSCTAETVVQKSFETIGLLTANDMAGIEHALQTRGSWSPNTVWRYQQQNLSVIYVELAAVLIRHRNRKLILLSCRDVAEQQRLQAEVQHQVDMAGRVQKSLLPVDYEKNQVTICSIFEPATLISGDFYGYRWFHNGTVLHGYLIDVTGHGVASALYTAAISSLLNEIMDKAEAWTTESITRLNRYLNQYFPDHSFAAMIAFTLNLSTRELTCISCGINYLLADTAEKKGLIAVPGLFLGAAENPYFETTTFSIQSGDTFYFMTDGIYDVYPKEATTDLRDFAATMERLRAISTSPQREDDCSALCLKIGTLEKLPVVYRFQSAERYEQILIALSAIFQRVAGDEACKLEAVIGEALSNACHYGTNICVKVNKVGAALVMRVKDDGPGFGGNEQIMRYRHCGLVQVFEQVISCENGRGIPIMLSWTDKLIYNAKGNEVMLIKYLAK
ncbi:MAG: PAS domain S-box protein [Sporomusaceae bacterium]|nr:PAS domain S-box protein [Sporomusaceae bacterium]